MASGDRALRCPWVNYPTHNRNKELQVSGERPIAFGYCGTNPDCSSCAGTQFKPNLRVEQGRSFLFIPCPHCSPDPYRKRVEKLKALLPKGVGPPPPPPKEEEKPGVKKKIRRRPRPQS